MVVEVKSEDLKGGLGQRITEMIAAQQLNSIEANTPKPFPLSPVVLQDR